MVYEDGDEEELEMGELKEALLDAVDVKEEGGSLELRGPKRARREV